MNDDLKRDWAAYCRGMAELTYALAECCDDRRMMEDYMALGARWVNRGIDGPPAGEALELADLVPANLLAA